MYTSKDRVILDTSLKVNYSTDYAVVVQNVKNPVHTLVHYS